VSARFVHLKGRDEPHPTDWTCPTCGRLSGMQCISRLGDPTSRPHAARVRAHRAEKKGTDQ